MTKKYAVIGAGHGGKAMAAHLALMGFSVNLFNRTADHVEIIKKRGGIELESAEGGPHGFGELALVTSKIAEAIKQVEVIMIVLPSSAHADVAKSMAPHLKGEQIVILHPGRTCGALEFMKVIRGNGCKADVTVAEAETFIYASRSDGPVQARIFRIKEAVPLAALPATRTQCVLDAICEAYPQFIHGVDVLNTGGVTSEQKSCLLGLRLIELGRRRQHAVERLRGSVQSQITRLELRRFNEILDQGIGLLRGLDDDVRIVARLVIIGPTIDEIRRHDDGG